MYSMCLYVKVGKSVCNGYIIQLSYVFSEVVDAMYDVHSGIKLTSHMEQGSSFSNCFSGESAVTNIDMDIKL